MSGNWNRCLSLCTGKYAKLVCADDILSPDALKREVDALEANPTAVIAESDTKLIDLNGKGKGFYKRYKKSGLVDGKKSAGRAFFHRIISEHHRQILSGEMWQRKSEDLIQIIPIS